MKAGYPYPAPRPPQIRPMPATYTTTTLSNGVIIATASMPHMESVAAGLWARVGARHETSSLHGIAHFTEHLLFKGTARRSPLQIVRDIESIGASANAYTSEDHTCYHAKGPASRFDRVCEILIDMYRFATFPEDEIQREREVIEEEITMYREQPSHHIDDLLSAVAWKGHALGRPITGTTRSLRRIGRADFQKFRTAHYSGRNTIVALAGRIDHEVAVDRLGPLIEGLEPGRTPRRRPFKPPASSSLPRVEIETRGIEQVHLSLAFYACDRLHPDRYALNLLSVILGENMSSRLWQHLREQTGYCYQVQSEVHALEDTGLLQFYAALDPSNLRDALGLISRELNRIARTPPSATELQQACEYTCTQGRLAMESTSEQMTWVGESLLAANRIFEPAATREAFHRVTPEDIQRVAASTLRRQNLAIAAIGPALREEEILEQLSLP